MAKIEQIIGSLTEVDTSEKTLMITTRSGAVTCPYKSGTVKISEEEWLDILAQGQTVACILSDGTVKRFAVLDESENGLANGV